MINHPVFFSPDVKDYLDFAIAGALTGDSGGLRKYFTPSLNPLRWRLRQGLIAYQIASKKINSPLSEQYYSMVPFAFGPNRAVKYSARPCASPSEANGKIVDANTADYLKSAMQKQLLQFPACFELMVQERRPGMPVEDATVEWSERESPYRTIGRITIPPQQFDSLEHVAFCENTAFNPWNAPAEHKPMGGINRLRRVLYEEISRYRHTRNNVLIPNPWEAWDKF
jgi:hypothetical protein